MRYIQWDTHEVNTFKGNLLKVNSISRSHFVFIYMYIFAMIKVDSCLQSINFCGLELLNLSRFHCRKEKYRITHKFLVPGQSVLSCLRRSFLFFFFTCFELPPEHIYIYIYFLFLCLTHPNHSFILLFVSLAWSL